MDAPRFRENGFCVGFISSEARIAGAGVKGAFRAVALVQPGPAARKWVFAPATLRTARAAMRRLTVTTIS